MCWRYVRGANSPNVIALVGCSAAIASGTEVMQRMTWRTTLVGFLAIMVPRASAAAGRYVRTRGAPGRDRDCREQKREPHAGKRDWPNKGGQKFDSHCAQK